MAQNKPTDTFYDHFSRDKVTKIGNWLVNSMSRRVFEFAQIGPGNSVLEIGPGRGAFADICLEKNIEYWAIEANKKMAADLEKRGAKVVRQMVPPIPSLGRTFDVVVMIQVMEHMDTMSAALQLTKEIYELLSPCGKLVIASPDYFNWRHHFFPSDFSHNYVTSWPRLRGLLISGGFENIERMYLSGPFKGIMCFLISAPVSYLPFDSIAALFPKNKLLHKLFKIQGTFLRSTLVIGKKPGSAK